MHTNRNWHADGVAQQGRVQIRKNCDKGRTSGTWGAFLLHCMDMMEEGKEKQRLMEETMDDSKRWRTKSACFRWSIRNVEIFEGEWRGCVYIRQCTQKHGHGKYVLTIYYVISLIVMLYGLTYIVYLYVHDHMVHVNMVIYILRHIHIELHAWPSCRRGSYTGQKKREADR